jgi:hypothetical protein
MASLLRHIRISSDIPIIVLSYTGAATTKVEALESGARLRRDRGPDCARGRHPWLRKLPDERARTMGENRFGVLQSSLRNLDSPLQDHKNTKRHFTSFDDVFAHCIRSSFTEPRQLLDLGRFQDRKHLITPCFDHRSHRLRHGSLRGHLYRTIDARQFLAAP